MLMIGVVTLQRCAWCIHWW